jgi:aryl-alcohol dehydrogenase-like predicted oxidoreductase
MAFIPWYPLNAGNVRSAELLQKVARQAGATVHQVALSWLLHHDPHILLIPGTSSVAHLEENLGATNVHLSDEQLKELDDLAAK